MLRELDINEIQDWCDRTGCVMLTPEELEKLKFVRNALNELFSQDGRVAFRDLIRAEQIMNEIFG